MQETPVESNLRLVAIPNWAKRSVKPRLASAPLVASLVICAHNEENNIGQLLTRLSADTSDIDLEILVVSSSTDSTDMVVRFCALIDKRIRLIRQPARLGKANALSLAISHSRAAVVVFLDADTIPLPFAMQFILTPFAFDPSLGVLTGSVRAINANQSVISRASSLLRDSHDELCIMLSRNGRPSKVNGTFFAARREIIETVPSDTVSDDEFISHCALTKGYRVDFSPKAVVEVVDPFIITDFIARRVRILMGHFWLTKRYGHKIPTTFFLLGLVCLFRAVKNGPNRLRILPLTMLLEFISRTIAMVRVWFGQVPYVYRIENTKMVPTAEEQTLLVIGRKGGA